MKLDLVDDPRCMVAMLLEGKVEREEARELKP